jgi:cytochrome c
MRAGRALAAAAIVSGTLAAPVAGAAPDTVALRAGEQIYERCAGCHSIEVNRAGPRHCGLFGRRAGTEPGFEGYSEAMKRSGIVWDERTLDRFVANPAATVPGTAMGYAGIADARERSELIAYLRAATRRGSACRVRP